MRTAAEKTEAEREIGYQIARQRAERRGERPPDRPVDPKALKRASALLREQTGLDEIADRLDAMVAPAGIEAEANAVRRHRR